MARRRTPREPAPPKAYVLSPDVADVANAVIAKHGVHFNALRSLHIGYVLLTGGRLPKRGKIDGWAARFIKVAPLWKALTEYDAIVEVRDQVWRILSATQREALVAHELSHGDVSEKGALVVQKHDLEEFAWIARHYGAWDEGIELFGKQLSLFGTPGGAAAGEQRPGNGAAKPPAKDDEGVVDLATHARRAREGRDKAPVVNP